MNFRKYKKLAYASEQINIVPLVNVALLLLIFFIFSFFLNFEHGLNIKFPKAITSDVLKEENLVVTITRENVVYFNGKVATLKELEGVLKTSANQGHSLLIKADRRASMGRVVDIWNICRRSGIEKINIATNQDK
ncbi:MAG: biopolymer transporter ExbD [Candidatus Omnitrophica bacterium]|nr:biopolymer transporter ExbD [Candidatus Omnitrophota bacterium]